MVAPRTRHPRPAVGLALAGGGFLGAAYELGVLAALAEGIDGLDLTALGSYVGVSAGAFIAAGLANGKTPHQMVRLFIEDTDAALDPAAMLRPARQLWRQSLASLPGIARLAIQRTAGPVRRSAAASAWDTFERLARALPAGVIDSAAAEKTLTALFESEHSTNDFRRLGTRLRIIATDIDTGMPIEFGAPGHDTVPISRAVIASSALPGVFAPVRIDGRFYVDGALNKTLHASVALNHGVSLLFCVNPLVPYSAGPATRPGTIALAGLPVILAQSIRTAIRSRMATGLQKYDTTHPAARLIVLEPRRDDAALFFTRIFTVSSRRRVCEQAYQRTRADLLARFDTIDPLLAAHGMRLNRQVLSAPELQLLQTARADPPAPRTSLRGATQRLALTLADLERVIRLARIRAAGG